MKFFLLISLSLIMSLTTALSYWSEKNNGLDGGPVLHFTVSENIIYAATNNGLFISQDTGKTWSRIGTGLPRGYVISFAISGKIAFAVIEDYGLFYSSDKCNTWTDISKSLSHIRTDVDDLISKIIFLGKTVVISTSEGIFISEDNGKTWIARNKGIEQKYISDMATNGKDIFIGTESDGVFISSDLGRTWTQRNLGLPELKIRTIAVTNDLFIIATKEKGIFISLNKGERWLQIFNGLEYDIYNPVLSILIIDKEIFVTIREKGVFHSTDEGKSWSEKNNSLDKKNVTSLATLGNSVFVGNYKYGVFKSTNKGGTWALSNKGLTNIYFQSLASYGFVNTHLWVGSRSGLFLSTDFGSTWLKRFISSSDDEITDLIFNGNNFFAATLNSGVMLSTDLGNTWDQKNNGLNDFDRYRTMKLSTIGSFTLVGTWGNGLWGMDRISDNWLRFNFLNTFRSVISIYTIGSKIYVGTTEGAFITYDMGLSWEKIMGDSVQVTSFVQVGNQLLVGTWGSGIYSSNDDGDTWVHKGLNDKIIYCLEYKYGLIFAGTQNGLLISKDTGDTWLERNVGLPSNTEFEEILIVNDEIFACGQTGLFSAKISDLATFIKPSISSISDVSMNENDKKTIPFVINSENLNKTNFIIQSSNPQLISIDSIKITGSGANRNLHLSPILNQFGESIITLKVTDGKDTAQTSFKVTVKKYIKPTISSISDIIIKENESKLLEFEINASIIEQLDLIIHSSNPELLPEDSIQVLGNEKHRILRISPTKQQFGESIIKIIVTDGRQSDSTIFKVTVQKSTSIQEHNYNNDILIYPNPADNFITINLGNKINVNSEGILIEIFNLSGSICLSKNIKVGNTKIDISKLVSGVYILKILDDYRIFVKSR